MDIYLFLPELIQKNYLNFILIFNSVGKCDLRDVWQVRRDNRQLFKSVFEIFVSQKLRKLRWSL